MTVSSPFRVVRGVLPGLLAVVMLLGAAGCDSSGESQHVFTGHSFLTTGSGAAKAGEACDKAGKSDCKSKLCIHYKSAPSDGWVCSRACQQDEDCPDLWRCVAITSPAEGNQYCVPPADWTPSAAADRAAAQP